MTERNDGGKGQADAPCNRCIVIRFFLMAVVGIALLYMLSPETFGLIEGFSTLTLALFFIGGLGLLAAGKVVLGLIKAEPRED